MRERVPDAELDDPLQPETILAAFSATERRGEWLPAEEVRVRALWGKVTLDLRRALLAPGVTEFECLAFCGEIEILVPPRLEVELAASSVLGSVQQRGSGGATVRRFIADQIRRAIDPQDQPAHEDDGDEPSLVRITGRAVLGSIVVKVR